jgi:hypothetical protein
VLVFLIYLIVFKKNQVTLAKIFWKSIKASTKKETIFIMHKTTINALKTLVIINSKES